MRTTLIINDEVLAEAKQLATERKSSLSALVNDALRRMIQQSSQHPKTPFRIPIYGRAHTVTDSSPTELANLEDPASFDPYSK